MLCMDYLYGGYREANFGKAPYLSTILRLLELCLALGLGSL